MNKPYEPMEDPVFLANQLFRVLIKQGYDLRCKNIEGDWIKGGDYISLDIRVHPQFEKFDPEIQIDPGNLYRQTITGRYEPE